MGDDRRIPLLKNKSFWTRLTTGFIICCFLVLAFVLGYTIMLCVLGCISLIGLWEFYRAEGILWKPFAIIGFIADIGYFILIRFYGYEYTTLYMVFLIALFVIAELVVYVVKYPKYELNEVFSAFFGVFYVGVTLSFLYLTRVHAWGAYLVWLAMIASWGCDIFAYLGGMLFGKKKIFPILSPKKTLEGCISGVIGAGILSFVYALCISGIDGFMDRWMIVFPIVCMLGAVIGMAGDLFASAIKRNRNIKDYSRLLPGHGGILDRFDSVIAVAPIIYVATIVMRVWK